MERLTERHAGQVFCNADCSEMIEYAEDCECPHIQKMRDKLAEYEDLEEQGMLHKAPFKIGQPIWIVGNELINDYVIRQFIVTENGIEAVKISKEINGKEYWNTFYTETWLVYVFLTKAEAEEALKKMEK